MAPLSKGRSTNLDVALERRGPLRLSAGDYVASGGEGSIYRSGRTIIKIYNDPDKMAREGTGEKVAALRSSLHHPGICAPQGLVFDPKGTPVGFYMPYVTGEPMPRVFVTDFRTRTGFNDADAAALSSEMRDIVASAHAGRALMVDANELNWLVQFKRGGKPEPIVIDVDSWAIGRWRPTVIMPSIRDFHSDDFTEATDWFSWGVVSFQVFTGIHPYKGALDGYGRGEWLQRMRDNASVFAPGARVPHSARDFAEIPGALRDWYRATFQSGLREKPPQNFAGGSVAPSAVVSRAATTPSGALKIDRIFVRAGDDVVRLWPSGAAQVASRQIIDLNTGQVLAADSDDSTEVVKVIGGWLIASASPNTQFRADFVANNGDRPSPPGAAIQVRKLFRAGDRLFGLTSSDRTLTEIQIAAAGSAVVFPRQWSVMGNATTWFDGVAVQDAMGAKFVMLPIGDIGMLQIRARALDGIRIVNAIASGLFAIFVGIDASGSYEKVELLFDTGGAVIKTWRGPTDGPEINAAIKSNGVVATVVSDGELVIYVPKNGNVNQVRDQAITTAMRLKAWGDRVVYVKDGAVWQVSLSRFA